MNTTSQSVSLIDPGSASTAFTIINSALVFLMVPGLGFFYAGKYLIFLFNQSIWIEWGLTRTKNALSLMLIVILCSAIVTIQWMLFGFSLSFSETSYNSFIGNFQFAGFANVGMDALAMTAPAIPSIALALYQLQFAAITPALIFGSVAERFRILPALIFVFLWSTFVYDPIAYWTFSARGNYKLLKIHA